MTQKSHFQKFMSSPYFPPLFHHRKTIGNRLHKCKTHKILNFLKLLIVTNCSNLTNYHIYNVISLYLSHY